MNRYDKPAPSSASAAVGTMGAKITVFDGIHAPKHYDLSSYKKTVVTFGRDPANDICITSHFVSRRHGRFRFEAGRWIIEDLGSTNGLLYKGATIPARMLCDNDNIRIDDGVETSTVGVLIVFNASLDSISWKSFSLEGLDTVTLGRDPSSNIVLNHVGVSRNHARIERHGAEFFIYDTNSTNGVFVNGVRLTAKTRLHEKDVITITNSRIVFTSTLITYCTFNKGIKVEASHIVKKVDKGRKTICNDVSLKIDPCELVAIIGGSGAGKSTIMNCISGYNKPTSGTVSVNGTELYSNFEAMKDIIGYVPQQDIVFDNLTVYSMLKYTAKLRLPKDTSEKELDSIILKVIDTVELTQRKDTMIKRLSGGQRKRASIAVELISDPTLFFLDEPASGLDPGTERNLMKTLKNMSSSGKTVIFVTHSTLNLRICDKIIFMGAGGKLCFMGSYDEALEFFGVDDLVDVYNMITENPDQWQKKYQSVRRDMPSQSPASYRMQKKKSKHSWLRQVAVLAKRHLHILVNDRSRLMLLLFQAPLLGVLISIVADGDQFVQQEMTKSLLFALSCSALWIGILNSIQEICKERVILRREYMTGLHLGAYVVSKMTVMGLVCLIQSALLTGVFCLFVGAPDTGIILPPVIEFYITTFMTAFSASAMGIFVSALFKNADRAMTVAPILLMPQLLFAGIIFKMEGFAEKISYFVTCRYSMQAYGSIADINGLEPKLFQSNPELKEMIKFKADELFDCSGGHFIKSIVIIAVFAVVFTILAGIAVRGVKKDY